MQYVFQNIYRGMFFSSIDETKKYLGENSFLLNCGRLAMVQFLQDRQSVSLFWESNYSQNCHSMRNWTRTEIRMKLPEFD